MAPETDEPVPATICSVEKLTTFRTTRVGVGPLSIEFSPSPEEQKRYPRTVVDNRAATEDIIRLNGIEVDGLRFRASIFQASCTN